MNNAGDRSFGLYVHIPFCLKKCHYCDFPSISITSPAILDDYLEMLQKEAALWSSGMENCLAETIFIGGGTPSLLEASQLEKLIRCLRRFFHTRDDAEITVEANPATIDRSKLKGFLEAGVNRLSLGVQSFSERELMLLGRVHRVKDVFSAIEDLQSLSWRNFGLDLIYGLPGQSIDDWSRNLNEAVQAEPAHISAYLLQLEPGTPLSADVARGRYQEALEEVQAEMYDLTRKQLAEKEYCHYEISNFCRPGMACRHNLGYWSGRSYLGLGSGAVSLIGCRRWANPWPVKEYTGPLASNRPLPLLELENMSDHDMLAEAMVMGLRMMAGIDLRDIEKRCGLNPREYYGDIIEEFKQRGWLQQVKDRLFLSPDYYFVSNQVLCHFLV